MEHTAARIFALVLDLTAFYFYKKSSHGFSRWCVVGYKVIVGLEVIASTAIHILSFLNLIGTFMSKSLISYAILFTSFHSSHFM